MRPALALALVAGLAACPRPEPSPEYRQARERFQAAAARSPLDPYAEPEMDEVLELLARVPPRSSDAEAAEALRRKIVDERQARADEEARRARILEAAGRPTAAPAAPPAGPAAAGPPAEAAPAGPPPSALPAGMDLEAFRERHGDCFELRGPAFVGDAPGEAWVLKEDADCRRAHPGEEGRLVLFTGGKLAGVREAAEARPVEVTEKVQGVRMPDGTIRPVGPDGKPRALPAGARVEWQPAPAEAAGRTAAPGEAAPPAAGGAR